MLLGFIQFIVGLRNWLRGQLRSFNDSSVELKSLLDDEGPFLFQIFRFPCPIMTVMESSSPRKRVPVVRVRLLGRIVEPCGTVGTEDSHLLSIRVFSVHSLVAALRAVESFELMYLMVTSMTMKRIG